MISICIPVYNTNVEELVQQLAKQVKEADIKIEIILLDDGSDSDFKQQNKKLVAGNSVSYFEFPINKGRIEARNALANLAKYEWLLFIDADSKIIRSDFLISYIKRCTIETDVLVGGRVYTSIPPQQCTKMLHWKYGSCRERSTKERFVFMTNNFCVRKTLFKNIQFPIAMKGYGHEDTWLGIQLRKMNARIVFFQNPVLHDGLEDAKMFIEKSKNALINLKALQSLVDEADLKQHVRLYKFYLVIRKLKITSLFLFVTRDINGYFFKNLNSCKASLKLFDIYRLHFFFSINKKV